MNAFSLHIEHPRTYALDTNTYANLYIKIHIETKQFEGVIHIILNYKLWKESDDSNVFEYSNVRSAIFIKFTKKSNKQTQKNTHKNAISK